MTVVQDLSPGIIPDGALLQPVFVGIEINPLCPQPAFCLYIHNGWNYMDLITRLVGSLECPWNPEARKTDNGSYMDDRTMQDLEGNIIRFLTEYSSTNRVKIQAAGIGIGNYHRSSYVVWGGKVHSSSNNALCGTVRLSQRLWLELDIIPCHVTHPGDSCLGNVGKLEEMANFDGNFCTQAIACHQGAFFPNTELDPVTHKVMLCDRIWLATMDDYQPFTSTKITNSLLEAARKNQSLDVTVSYFSSTPRGGGVAQMRHAWMRFANTLGIKANWYVAHPNHEIFQVTKKCFHNGLQGVQLQHACLTYQDVAKYEAWCKENYGRWKVRIIPESSIVVIDDFQLSGLIPHIKRDFPDKKILFRCHIAIRTDLIADPESNTSINWSYLWGHISAADLFLFHPISSFVPPCVPFHRVWMLPAFLDPLDGLNKSLSPAQISHYQSVINRISLDTNPDSGCGKVFDFANREYLLQLSRFDPSKGITDVLDCYRMLREQWAEQIGNSISPPALIIAGVGSVDDPEGNSVFEAARAHITHARFVPFADDIFILQLPPCDQLMNTLLSRAKIYLQLSIQEGFEIKVTEAIRKQVPVVAYKSGGISLQIRDGETGLLAPTHDKKQIVKHLWTLLRDQDMYRHCCDHAINADVMKFMLPYQACSWVHLINAVSLSETSNLFQDSGADQFRHVESLWA